MAEAAAARHHPELRRWP
uniref:Uncharacterized protein n=1 Tax=Arundo donax TaxID=35708 RepID=A0A0A9H278_ARUDO